VRCQICTYALGSGKVTTVLGCAEIYEAPNWSRDGAHLLVNGGGRLFRLPLDRPRLEPVDTGALTQLNNDHGLSPDGRMLAISDKTEHGQSAVYVLPAAGGTPRPVTPARPSYWHGWSPDGATLAYVGRRDGCFDICTCPVAGGRETRLTSGFDHCDGPDYTPDGQWIWFNAERGGRVDLWRMHPDGSGLSQMTDDATVNWFPHPSPDGKHLLYLAFPPRTQGHPFGKEVTLRLMPAGGGPARDLVGIFGGQGSINVPCWAPDSRAFAFVRYPRSDGGW